MSTHKIDAVRSGTSNGMDFDNDYEITFSYVPSRGNYDQSGGHWNEPAEVSFVSITPDAGDHGAYSDIAQRWLVEWAEEWLAEHHDECVELAEQDMQPDPDYERDRRIDDKLTGDDR